VIFGNLPSLLLFAQSLPPDGHVKNRGAGIASSDDPSNAVERQTSGRRAADERPTLIGSGFEK